MDVATLGLSIDSSQAVLAAKELGRMADGADKAETSAKKMSGTMQRSMADTSAAAQRAAASLDAMLQAQMRQEKLLQDMQRSFVALTQAIGASAAANSASAQAATAAAAALTAEASATKDATAAALAHATASNSQASAIKGATSHSSAFAGTTDGLATSLRAMAGALAVQQVYAFGKAVFEASASAERLRTTLDFSTGGNGAKELRFVTQTANELGLQVGETAKAYGKLAAAAQGTSLEGAGARDIFTAVAKASAVMGLSASESGGALTALQQMISKGTVQSEELRGQLGERLPGAFQIAARAMGVTTQELGKMLELGLVPASEFIPKLAAQLEKELGDAATSAADRLDASLNRMVNSWEKLKQTVGDAGISKAIAGHMQYASEIMSATSDTMNSVKDSGGNAFLQLGAGALALASKLAPIGQALEFISGGMIGVSSNAKDVKVLEEKIQGAVERMVKLQSLDAMPGQGNYFKGQIADTQAYITKLLEAKAAKDLMMAGGPMTPAQQAKAETKGWEAQAIRSEERAAELKAYTDRDIRQTKAQQKQEEYAKAEKAHAEMMKKFDGDKVAQAKIELALTTEKANLDKKFAEKKTGSGMAAGESEAASIRARLQATQASIKAMQEYGVEAEKQNEADKLVFKLKAELEGGIKGVARANKEAALASAESWQAALREEDALKKKNEAMKKNEAAYQKDIEQTSQSAEKIGQQADAIEAQNAVWGKSRTAIEAHTLATMKNNVSRIAGQNLDGPKLDALKREAEEQERLTKALQAADYKRMDEHTTKLLDNAKEQAKLYEDELELTGLTATERAKVVAVRAVELKYAKEIKAVEDKIPDDTAERQAQILKLQEAKQIESVTAVNKVTQDAYAKTSESIGNSLTEALMRGFEGGKDFAANLRDTVVNMFKTMVLRPVIQAIMAPIAGGISGAVNAATGSDGGASGSFFDKLNGSISNGLKDGFAKFASSPTGQSLGFSSVGPDGMGPPGMTSMGQSMSTAMGVVGDTLAGYAMGSMAKSLISGGYSMGKGMETFQKVGIAVSSAVFGPIGGAVAGAVSGVVNRLFGRKFEDSGIKGSFGGAAGFEGQQYEKYKGGLFRSDKTNYSEVDKTIQNYLSGSFKAFQAQIGTFATELGLSTDKIAGFTSDVKISTKDIKDEAGLKQALDDAIKAGSNELAQQVIGTWEKITDASKYTVNELGQMTTKVDESGVTWKYQASEYAKFGESAIETLTRLGGALSTINGAFDMLGTTLLDKTLAGAQQASQIADAFGGVDKASSAMGAYYQSYYSDAEKTANATRLMHNEFNKLGVAYPESTGSLRKLIEAQDLSTESGRKMYAALVQVAPGFAEIESAAKQVEDAAKQNRQGLYTTAELKASAVADLGKEFKDLGVTMPKTGKELRTLIEQQYAAGGSAAGLGEKLSALVPKFLELNQASTSPIVQADSGALTEFFKGAIEGKPLAANAGEELGMALVDGFKSQIATAGSAAVAAVFQQDVIAKVAAAKLANPTLSTAEILASPELQAGLLKTNQTLAVYSSLMNDPALTDAARVFSSNAVGAVKSLDGATTSTIDFNAALAGLQPSADSATASFSGLIGAIESAATADSSLKLLNQELDALATAAGPDKTLTMQELRNTIIGFADIGESNEALVRLLQAAQQLKDSGVATITLDQAANGLKNLNAVLPSVVTNITSTASKFTTGGDRIENSTANATDSMGLFAIGGSAVARAAESAATSLSDTAGALNSIPRNIKVEIDIPKSVTVEVVVNTTQQGSGVQGSFAVGSLSIPKDMTANIHKGEMIIDSASANVLRKYGINASASIASNGGDNVATGLLASIDKGIAEIAPKIMELITVTEKTDDSYAAIDSTATGKYDKLLAPHLSINNYYKEMEKGMTALQSAIQAALNAGNTTEISRLTGMSADDAADTGKVNNYINDMWYGAFGGGNFDDHSGKIAELTKERDAWIHEQKKLLATKEIESLIDETKSATAKAKELGTTRSKTDQLAYEFSKKQELYDTGYGKHLTEKIAGMDSKIENPLSSLTSEDVMNANLTALGQMNGGLAGAIARMKATLEDEKATLIAEQIQYNKVLEDWHTAQKKLISKEIMVDIENQITSLSKVEKLPLDGLKEGLAQTAKDLLALKTDSAQYDKDLAKLAELSALQLGKARKDLYDQLLSPEELKQNKAADLAIEFTKIGAVMPGTTASLRAMIDAARAAGNTTLADNLLQLVPTFVSLQGAVTSTVSVLEQALKSLRDEYAAMEPELLRAQGRGAEAKVLERDAALKKLYTDKMTESDKAAIAAQYDLNQARRDEITRLNEQTGLTQSLNQALGNTAALRAAELAALDASNRPLKQRIYDLEDANAKVDAALSTVQRSVDAEKTRIQKDSDARIKAIQAGIDGSQKAIDAAKQHITELTGIFDDIANGVKTLRNNATDEVKQIENARAYIDMALVLARAGAMPNATKLRESISAVTQDNADQYITGADFRFAQMVQAGKLEELGALTGQQKTIEEQTLKTLEGANTLALEQIRAIEADTQRQIEALDLQLKTAQDAVSVMRGVDLSVQAVGTAITALSASIAAQAAATAAAKAAVVTKDYSGYYQAPTDPNFAAQQAAATAAGHKIRAMPSFAVGTDYVPYDMIAQIHEGEKIVPKAFNPAAMQQGGQSNAELVAELRDLRLALDKLQQTAETGNINTRRTADAVNGQNESPFLVEIAE